MNDPGLMSRGQRRGNLPQDVKGFQLAERVVAYRFLPAEHFDRDRVGRGTERIKVGDVPRYLAGFCVFGEDEWTCPALVDIASQRE